MRHRAAVVLVVCVWVLFLSPRALVGGPDLNEEGFPKIRVGMSLEKVRELLGGREGNYGSYPDNHAIATDEGFWCPPNSHQFREPLGRAWYDDDDRFEVCFSRDSRVLETHRRGWEMRGSPFDWLRRLFGG